MDTGQIILFQTQGGDTKIEVRLANEAVWLTADQMQSCFNVTNLPFQGTSRISMKVLN